MAGAAFKSTTRRSCGIKGTSCDGGSVSFLESSSTPTKGQYRRSRSLSDFIRYVDDSATMEDLHSDSVFETAKVLTRHQLSDSEKRGSRSGDDQNSSDHPEEEKTIRAVHTQKKELSACKLDSTNLYEVMRAELQKAVAHIRDEVEQVVQKEFVMPSSPCPGGWTRLEGHSVDSVDFTDATNLEQSEKRAQELWCQLAVEERRCVNLLQFIREIAPSNARISSRSLLQPRATSPIQPNLELAAEKQLESESLDARRFFEAWISGSDPMCSNTTPLVFIDGNGKESFSWKSKGVCSSSDEGDLVCTLERKAVVLQPLISFCSQNEQAGILVSKSSATILRTPVLNNDGLILPWLQWDTDLKHVPQEYGVRDQDEEDDIIAIFSASTSGTAAMPPGTNDESSSLSDQMKDEKWSFDFSAGCSGCMFPSVSDRWKCTDSSSTTNMTARPVRREVSADVETFVLRRLWLRHQIKQGRVLVCGGRLR